jgi:DNA-binding protein YbaB
LELDASTQKEGSVVEDRLGIEDLGGMMSLLHEQMRDLAALQEKRTTLVAKATAAEGAVEVTVDVQGVVSEIVIEETYLDDNELADLGGHIVSAVRKAAQEVGRQSAALLEPMTQRRQTMRSMTDIAGEMPDFSEVMSFFNPPTPPPNEPRVEGDEENSAYPNVRNV